LPALIFTDDLRRLCDDPVNFPLIETFFSRIVTRAPDNHTPSDETYVQRSPAPQDIQNFRFS
jgi:hypothetical protein